MPSRTVSLPTPEQERQAILAMIAFGALALMGLGALLVGAFFAMAGVLRMVAGWIWGS